MYPVTFLHCDFSKLLFVQIATETDLQIKYVLRRFGCSCQGTRSSTILLRFSTSARQVGFMQKDGLITPIVFRHLFCSGSPSPLLNSWMLFAFHPLLGCRYKHWYIHCWSLGLEIQTLMHVHNCKAVLMLYFVLVCARITYYIWYTMYIICIRRISSVCVMLKIKHSSQPPTHINTKLLEGENDSVEFSSLVWDDPTLLLIMTLASRAIQYKPKKGVWDSSPCVCGGSPVSKLLLTLCAATACPLTKTRLG